MVTHSTAAASRAQRVLFIKDGILYNQIFKGDKSEHQMFQEISDTLTVSNLIKNRKLYYPYALATILAIAITYIFTSLTLNPHLDDLTGADPIKMVLGMGLVIVALSSGIIVLYANSFVMKNRSKELGLYSMLGLEKRHLFSMILWGL